MVMSLAWVACGCGSGTTMRNVLPLPMALLTFMQPPSSLTRSRMLSEPNPPVLPGPRGSNPRPLSDMRTVVAYLHSGFSDGYPVYGGPSNQSRITAPEH